MNVVGYDTIQTRDADGNTVAPYRWRMCLACFEREIAQIDAVIASPVLEGAGDEKWLRCEQCDRMMERQDALCSGFSLSDVCEAIA